MPELPEVETVRVALESVISGQTIESVRLTR
ncbi:MAG: DNA-formamidopyrimidine glycosylase family protein, partial [Pseudomonadota bacterium]|nr:DNA-formamidopyrimidine glycosylase family protein [Pseudomonadota bacterium]